MTRLTIDPAAKRIELDVLLAGEVHPISATVGRYHLLEQAGQTALIVDEITLSRPWMQLLAQEHLLGKPLILPSAARLIL